MRYSSAKGERMSGSSNDFGKGSVGSDLGQGDAYKGTPTIHGHAQQSPAPAAPKLNPGGEFDKGRLVKI
jgi:hypothetical protein